MKVFVAGIATESNTFSPTPTGLEDFAVQRGRDATRGIVDHPSLDLTRVWGNLATANGCEFVFGLMARAQPGGVTVQSAYESLREEILQDLRSAMPVDIVLLMLHGAMAAYGYQDCELDLLCRIRQIVGSGAVVCAELDLHCHLYPSKLLPADLIVTYKEYPHVDVNDRAAELFHLAVETRRRSIKPTMALFDCRMVGSYPTSRQPLRRFVDEMALVERRPGVLSVSFAHGFRFADVPYVGAKMLVVTDDDRALAESLAQELGHRVYALRRDIGFDSISLPMEEALTRALEEGASPVIVADQSDNIGGGAPGDATYALRWLLDHKAKDVAIGIFYDPEVVKVARKVGPSGAIRVRLGGKLGPSSGDPLDLQVTVRSQSSNYRVDWPQQSGVPMLFPAGDVVALSCESIDIVVSTERCQCLSPTIFRDLGIDLKKKQVVVCKSNQHFYTAFAPIAGQVLYMAAPGALSPDPKKIPYRSIDKSRLYPWVDDPLARENQPSACG